MALSVELKKTFGEFRLETAFTAENCVHGLLGASGCGKSMTLKCIAEAIRPDEGRIVLDGEVLFDSAAHINQPPQKRGLGLLFQNFALFPNMTVEQNVMAALHGAGDKKAARARCGDMLRRLSLEEVKGLRPWQLSGGQQQRAALARILVTTPRLLMLDEPFSALDSYLRWQTELELTELLDGFDGTVLLVTHSRDEVYRLCDTVTVLDHGVGRGEAPVRTLSAAGGDRGYSRLRLELPKEDWASVGGGGRLWLELPPEALLPLVE